MKRICTICARGGSKGVPGKNIRPLMGKPLLAHSIEQARESGLFDAIAVSSDDDDILSIGLEWKATHEVLRPQDLSTDQASKISAIAHCVDRVESIEGSSFDTVVDLDVTSPLRSVDDIRNAVKFLESGHADNVVSGAPSRRSPYFNLVEADEEGYVQLSKKTAKPIVRRQDSPRCYDLNASIYVWRRENLSKDKLLFQSKTALYEMPEERSWDIDTDLDFLIVEALMKRKTEAIS